MEWASTAGNRQGSYPPLHRRTDIYDTPSTNAYFHVGAYDTREDHTEPWDAASSGSKQIAFAVSAASRAPPLPSYSLCCLSLCVAFLSVFTAHLHEASLSLLISRGVCQLPFLDHAVEGLPSERAVFPTVAAFKGSPRAPKDDHSIHTAASPRPSPDFDVFQRSSSAVIFRVDRLPPAPLQRPATTRVTPTSSRTFSQISQAYTSEQSTDSTMFSCFCDTALRILSAGKACFYRTFTEILKTPSPLPQGLPFAEDVLVAWHLLLQTIGCLLCGAIADTKGRRWVLSHAIQVLAATSFLFTFAALTTAQLLHASKGHSNVDFPKGVASNIRDVDGIFPANNSEPTVLAELPRAACMDCEGSQEERSTLPVLPYLPAWLPPVNKLTSFFPRFSAQWLWTVLLHILILLSVMCYSLAALACGGAIVVAQCLCLEAAVSFPLQSSRDYAEQCCHSSGTQQSGNNDLPAVCRNAVYGGSGRADESDQTDAAARAAGVLFKGNSSEGATVSLFPVDASVDAHVQGVRVAELCSPLLAQGQRSPRFFGTARNVIAQLCFRTRSFFGTVWDRCKNTHAGLRTSFDAAIHRILSSTRKVSASVYRASVLPFFFSSPYIPVAYLVGMQSAAHLFLPVALSTVLEALSFSGSSGPDSSDLADKSAAGPLTPFTLFCVAFSIPILPFCILLCVLTNCFLGENPYFFSQRDVLLRHLSIVNYASTACRLAAKHPASRTPSHAAERGRDTMSKIGRRAFVPSAWRRRLLVYTDKRNGDSSYSSLSSSLSLPSLAEHVCERQACCPGWVPPGQRQSGEPSRSPFRRMARRRRALSYSGPDNLTSPRHQASSRLTLSLRLDVSTPVITARHIKKTRHTAGDLSSSRRVIVCGSRHDEHLSSLPLRRFAGYQKRPFTSVQPAYNATGTASHGVPEQGIEGGRREEVAAESGNSVTRQHYERGERSDLAASGNVISAARKSLRVYQSYLNSNYSTSLLGVLLPATFIGASLYIRGVFRFLLLDCVVIEEELEGKAGTTQAARGAGFGFESTGRDGVVPMNRSPFPQVILSSGFPATSTLHSSSSYFTASPAVLPKGELCARGVSAELLLFQLSIPVLFVRFCTCVIPVILLLALPPKPLQMLGCIFCGFLSFGIAVTLEALAQNFPDIPPISSAGTACLLYEVVFCFCCCIPAFTSVLLPMQGFHTGVRCGFVAAVSACVRAAAAVSMVILSALLSCFRSNVFAKDSDGASKPAVEELYPVSSVDLLSAPGNNRSNSVSHTFSSTTQGPTSSSDSCSANAALIAATTCVFYVMAAAFTLLYTTHVRLPGKLISSPVKRIFRQTELQGAQPKNGIPQSFLDGEQKDVQPERRPTMRWTENIRENTLLAVDNLLLQKLQPSLAIIHGGDAKQGPVRGEAEPKA